MDFAAARSLPARMLDKTSLRDTATRARAATSNALAASRATARHPQWSDVRAVASRWQQEAFSSGRRARAHVRDNPHTALAVAAVGSVVVAGVVATSVRRHRAAQKDISAPLTPGLPAEANYPGAGPSWDRIAFGVFADGSTADMRLFYTPHALLVGGTGSGKTVTARSIYTHCLMHADDWEVVGIDLWKVELASLRRLENASVHTSLADAVIALAKTSAEMERRYRLMEDAAVMNFRDLAAPPRAILVHIDELAGFSPQEEGDEAEANENFLRAEAVRMLEGIARLGRAAGIHLLVSTQRATEPALTDDLLANLDLRIVMGRCPSVPLGRILGADTEAFTPIGRGRGLVCARGHVEEFQSYFCPPDWYDQQVAAQDAQDNSAFFPISLLRTPSGVVISTSTQAESNVAEAVIRLAAHPDLHAVTASTPSQIRQALRRGADIIGFVGSLDDPKVIDSIVWAGTVGCVVYVAAPGYTHDDVAARLRVKAEARQVGCQIVPDTSV